MKQKFLKIFKGILWLTFAGAMLGIFFQFCFLLIQVILYGVLSLFELVLVNVLMRFLFWAIIGIIFVYAGFLWSAGVAFIFCQINLFSFFYMFEE